MAASPECVVPFRAGGYRAFWNLCICSFPCIRHWRLTMCGKCEVGGEAGCNCSGGTQLPRCACEELGGTYCPACNHNQMSTPVPTPPPPAPEPPMPKPSPVPPQPEGEGGTPEE